MRQALPLLLLLLLAASGHADEPKAKQVEVQALQGYTLAGANRRVYPGCGTGVRRSA